MIYNRVNKIRKEQKMTLKKLREAKGLSRKELADLVGVTEMSIWNYENGKTKPDRYNIITRLAEVLEIELKILVAMLDI